MQLWFGQKDYGFTGSVDDVLPLLTGRCVPQLRSLGLCNAEFTDALIEPLARSPLLPRLRELSLALGTLSDAGAAELARHRAAFAHLERLDLEDNCMTSAGIERVEDICAEVLIGEQKGGNERYASVGE
jgi:hypothetical protein